MIIHLLRHGISIDRLHPKCPDDADRFLTKEGKKRTRAAMLGLKRIGIDAERILVSPYVRARQTAEIAIDALGLKGELEESSALVWDAAPRLLEAELQRLSDMDSVLCVGHAPQLDLFIAQLLGTPMPISELKKAGFATIETAFQEPGDGILRALYPPRVLRRLGGAK